MDYQTITVWTVLKRFLDRMAGSRISSCGFSCIKYREFIITAFSNNTWAWINAVMPIV